MDDTTEGARLRDEGMATAIAHAERDAPGWGRAALLMVEAFCKNLGQLPFMNEDVRVYAYARGLPLPPDDRAWGGVMRTALLHKVVRQIGTRPVKAASGHRGPRALWIAYDAPMQPELPEHPRIGALVAEVERLRERIRVERGNHLGTLTLLRVQKRVNRTLRRQLARAMSQRITHLGAAKDDRGNIIEHLASPACWCRPTLDYVDPLTGNGVWVHKEKADAS
jgi:hypothetical protein